MNMNLADIRTEYARAGLSESDLFPSPIRQLERWLGEAIDAEHPEPTTFTLATISATGEPSARIMMLKDLSDEGLVFYTNYDSDKGADLSANPRACASFFWVLFERQVRATGPVAKVSRSESEAYFRTRPRESQIGAWASRQSSAISGRAELDRLVAEVRARFGDGDVPCPPTWGGYRLTPERVEFWQGRPSRLHDRLRYARATGSAPSWKIERLAP